MTTKLQIKQQTNQVLKTFHRNDRIAQLREQIEGSVIKSGTHKHAEDGPGKAL